MDPVIVTATIDRPREEVFDYLVDVANHLEFSDHYLEDFRLLRLESRGRGAGARFKLTAPLNRFSWADMTFVEVERPYRIVAFGRGGKFNRNKNTTIWTLDEASGGATRVEVMTETEPALATDRFIELVTGYRIWMRRNLGRAVSRLQAILEENEDRGRRATVAGV